MPRGASVALHAKVKSFDAAPALAVPGVREVFAVSQGVAVLADGYWAAKKGRDALKIVWDESGTESRGSDQIVKEYVDLMGGRITVLSAAHDDHWAESMTLE